MSTIVYDSPEIDALLMELTGCKDGFGPGHSIGTVDSEGNPLGGFYYCSIGPTNCFTHVAGKTGSNWLSRKLLFQASVYPFLQLGCNRVTGWVEASNVAARRLDEHLGFVPEAVLRGAAADGGDVIVYVLWRDKCRFLEYDYVKRCR